MTVRNDLSVNFNVNPRIITVDAPSTEITMQDAVDTLRSIEASAAAMDNKPLVSAAGKEDLGGGTEVGLTVTLLDSLIAFKSRITPQESGTTTSAGTTSLIDTAATFITNNALPGGMVINFTDFSLTTIITVVSETELLVEALEGGTNNDFTLGDTYRVYNETQCNLTGGNMVAVDGVGASIDPVFPTVGTQIVRSSSSSATIAGLEIANLQRLIESLRPHHTGTGDIWYWDPYAGIDTNAGNHPSKAVKTFAKAQELAADNNHDIIIGVPGNPNGVTLTTENITISKNYLFLRGPGRDFAVNSADDNLDAILVTGDGAEVSGMSVTTSATSTKCAVHTVGDFTLIKNIWVYEAVDGVHFENCEYGIADNVKMHHNSGVGLKFSGTCDHVDIIDCHVGSNQLDNVVFNLDSATHEINLLGETVIHGSVTGYGLNISATTNGVIIHDSVAVFNNFAGDINDLSTSTYNTKNEDATAITDSVWADENALTVDTYIGLS